MAVRVRFLIRLRAFEGGGGPLKLFVLEEEKAYQGIADGFECRIKVVDNALCGVKLKEIKTVF